MPAPLPAIARPLAAGPVAQWLEPAAHNGLVAGSSPAGPTILINRRHPEAFVIVRRRLQYPLILWGIFVFQRSSAFAFRVLTSDVFVGISVGTISMPITRYQHAV